MLQEEFVHKIEASFGVVQSGLVLGDQMREVVESVPHVPPDLHRLGLHKGTDEPDGTRSGDARSEGEQWYCRR